MDNMEGKMGYKEQYNKSLSEYKEIMANYEKIITSPRYHEILSTMPFEFLNAIQLCEQLSLFQKLETKPKMSFSSLDEAKVFYRNLIHFNKKTEKLLEDASYIAEVGRLAKMVNDCAVNSPYLGKTFCIEVNTEITELAKKCLSEIPRFPDILTKKFRWNYIESVILSLDKNDLKSLVESKVIKANDIDHICLITENQDYYEKIKYLCEVLNHPQPIMQTYQLKLKGVTFPNDDGSSRQENLTMLKKYNEEHPDSIISLTAESYTYVPEIGDPEPAIKIAWDGKVIGNIGNDVVEEISKKYKSPQMTATLEKVSGGDDKMNFGCVIKLNIIAPGYADISHTEEYISSQNTQQER